MILKYVNYLLVNGVVVTGWYWFDFFIVDNDIIKGINNAWLLLFLIWFNIVFFYFLGDKEFSEITLFIKLGIKGIEGYDKKRELLKIKIVETKTDIFMLGLSGFMFRVMLLILSIIIVLVCIPLVLGIDIEELKSKGKYDLELWNYRYVRARDA